MSVGVVYIMSNKAGLLKIGNTNSIKNRLSMLKCGDPTIKAIYVSEPLLNRVDVERLAHEKLSDKRVAGEWFSCPPDDATEAIVGSIKSIGVKEDVCLGYNKDSFEERLESTTNIANGIQAKMAYDKNHEIISEYIDIIQKVKPEYLTTFARKSKGEAAIESAVYLAGLYLDFKKEDK